MDDSRFDALSRAFGGAVSRRSGLVALGALLGGVAIGEGTAASGRKRPKPEGPCGDGSRKDNICTKGDDCCTGSCDLSKGKTNKDGLGRCRCVRKGGSCTEDRNCCGGRICGGGSVCGGPVVPVGSSCVVGVDLCADGATCQQQTGGVQTIQPNSGYFCSQEDGGSCTDPSTIGATECVGGWCSSAGNVCGEIVVQQTCTAQTNSCAGTDLYVTPVGFCSLSVGGKPIALVPAGGATGPCSTDNDCSGIEVCVALAAGSQCLEFFQVSAGTQCLPGAFLCSVDGDCPVKTGSAVCATGYCLYP